MALGVTLTQPTQELPHLGQCCSRTTPHVMDLMRQIPGDFVMLSAAGKMGWSLSLMTATPRPAWDVESSRNRCCGGKGVTVLSFCRLPRP